MLVIRVLNAELSLLTTDSEQLFALILEYHKPMPMGK